MADLLHDIIAHKRLEIEAARKYRPFDELRREVAKALPARDFFAALHTGPNPRIIAECKRKSPSRGTMAKFYRPVDLAKAYERGGAAAISVLTDAEYFGGSLSDLHAVRSHVGIPVLRKDFIIDEYQVYEARAYGADSFLLLAGVLDTEALDHLLGVGRSLGMEALVESHTAAELALARGSSARVLGVNNRDLKSFSVDLERARALHDEALLNHPERILVCESGIKGPKDIEQMGAVGYKVFLIGEALVTHPDPEEGIQSFIKNTR